MMTLGIDLLRRLASGLNPAGAEKPAKGLGGADPAALSFAEMLAKADKGEIASGLPVTIAKDAGVELTDDQLARVAIAADRAQAAGADRAVVIIDNLAVKLDVATRTISGKADLAPGSTLADIHAVGHRTPSQPLGRLTALPHPGHSAEPDGDVAHADHAHQRGRRRARLPDADFRRRAREQCEPEPEERPSACEVERGLARLRVGEPDRTRRCARRRVRGRAHPVGAFHGR